VKGEGTEAKNSTFLFLCKPKFPFTIRTLNTINVGWVKITQNKQDREDK